MDLVIAKTYESVTLINFSIKERSKTKLVNLRLVPSFKHYSSNEGVLSYGIKNKSIGFEVDQNMLHEIKQIEDRVRRQIYLDGYNLDIGCTKRYIKDDVEKISMWAEIIKSNDGRIYTKCYDTSSNVVDIMDCKCKMITRPSFTFKLSYNKEKNTHKLKAVISELCIIKKLQTNSLIPVE